MIYNKTTKAVSIATSHIRGKEKGMAISIATSKAVSIATSQIRGKEKGNLLSPRTPMRILPFMPSELPLQRDEKS